MDVTEVRRIRLGKVELDIENNAASPGAPPCVRLTDWGVGLRTYLDRQDAIDLAQTILEYFDTPPPTA